MYKIATKSSSSSSDYDNSNVFDREAGKKLIRKRKKTKYRKKQKLIKFDSLQMATLVPSSDDEAVFNAITREKPISNAFICENTFCHSSLQNANISFKTNDTPINYSNNFNFNSSNRSSTDTEANSTCSDPVSPRKFFDSSDEISSDESHEEPFVNLKEFLFQNSQTTIKEFLYSIYLVKVKHKLSDDSVADFLKLIKHILPEQNKCPISLNKFEKELFNDHKGTFYHMCIKCNKIIESCPFKDFKHKKKYCNSCESELVSFIQLDVESQLTSILNKEKIIQIKTSINNARSSLASEKILNATDGLVYKNFVRDFDKNLLLVSINLNSDGAPFIKSTSSSLWPVIGTITELHPSSKDSFENLIIFGSFF
jgi:hypothetical protein